LGPSVELLGGSGGCLGEVLGVFWGVLGRFFGVKRGLESVF